MKPVYEAAGEFVRAALSNDDSLFTPGTPIWSLPVLGDLRGRFTERPDVSRDSFEVKFKRQLSDAPPRTVQLAGELLYVYFLASGAVGYETKKSIIERVLSWSSAPVAIPERLLPAMHDGVAYPGMAFNTQRPWLLSYLIAFVMRWKGEPPAERETFLRDAGAFKRFVFGIPGARAQTQQHALLHLVHPEAFEPLTSQTRKQKIVAALGAGIANMPDDVDRGIALIRERLAPEYGPNFMFYDPGLRERWMSGESDDDEHSSAAGETGADSAAPQGDEPAFRAQAFELLAGLHANPTRAYAKAHEAELDAEVVEPFRALFRRVVAKLPGAAKEYLETEARLFSRFAKNDYGRGGAWDFYWGALYPKEGSRIDDLQLFVRIDHDHLSYGFDFGSHSKDPALRFSERCRERAGALEEVLGPRLEGRDLFCGARIPIEESRRSAEAMGQAPSLGAWLRDPEAVGPAVRGTLVPEEVIDQTAEQLAEKIAGAFEALYPLVLLALADDFDTALDAYLGEDEFEADSRDPYSLDRMANESGLERDVLESWVEAIERKGQAILYGPPGTGKTYVARMLARHLAGGSDGLVEMVQFHPAYAYEDFIQGIRPRVGPGQTVAFDMVRGLFLDFCHAAKERRGRSVLIIDEINRANLARVFGELMYLLEYRGESVPLAGGGRLQVPANVRIVGTMNTADRSIALVDHALRRRFAFLKLRPDYDLLRRFHARENPRFPVDALVALLVDLNHAIDDEHYEVGITFFLVKDLGARLEHIWMMEIEPYLEEYFFDQSGKVSAFRWERVRSRVQV